MRYRVTFESGAWALVDIEGYWRLLRQAGERGWALTQVRAGHVVTLPSGALVAMLREGP
ncbi:hypothetical protein ABZ128_09325 [Streptomyces sp. NPDC006326]|uniref:hypothetical protein n=1 Tax=Streptomyces sp. NPDC006326 TaxID=3156752 RepID=UPI0033A07835